MGIKASSGLGILLALTIVGGGIRPALAKSIVVTQPEALHELACSQLRSTDSPWSIGNLYDCENRSMFVPYQLWTGARWDGDKDADCMHPASTTFFVNGTSGTRITGPKEWNGRNVWAREKSSGRKLQYFECHDRGIGRVYEIRGGKKRVFRETGRCKFPAGYGWRLSERRDCTRTAIEVDKMEFTGNGLLRALEFKWWYVARDGRYVLDHRYRYLPNRSMTRAWRKRW